MRNCPAGANRGRDAKIQGALKFHKRKSQGRAVKLPSSENRMNRLDLLQHFSQDKPAVKLAALALIQAPYLAVIGVLAHANALPLLVTLVRDYAAK